MKKFIVALLLLILCNGMAQAQGGLPKQNMVFPTMTDTLISNDTDTLIIPTPLNYGGYVGFWVCMDTLARGDEDSISVQYVRNRTGAQSKVGGEAGHPAPDSLANRPASLRYADIEQGASLIPFNNYDWIDGGWYFIRINQEGMDYGYVECLLTYTASGTTDSVAFKIYEAAR